jgi:integrase
MIGELLKTPGGSVQRPYQVLSEPEAVRLLGAAGSARDRALVALLLGAGLRAGELVALDVGDLREDERGDFAVHVRASKGARTASSNGPRQTDRPSLTVTGVGST